MHYILPDNIKTIVSNIKEKNFRSMRIDDCFISLEQDPSDDKIAYFSMVFDNDACIWYKFYDGCLMEIIDPLIEE